MNFAFVPVTSLKTNVEINSLAFSPDGKRLACGGFADRYVQVMDVNSGNLLFKLDLEASGSLSNQIAWSANNLIAASSPINSRIGIWRGDDGSFLKWLDTEVDEIASLAFDAKGENLCVAGTMLFEDCDTDLNVFDTASWEMRTFSSGMQVNAAGWRGDIMVAVGESRDINYHTLLRAFKPDDLRSPLLDLRLSGTSEGEAQLVFDPRGQLHVVSWRNESCELIWRTVDIDQKTVLREVPFGDTSSEGLACSAATMQLIVLVPDGSGQALKLLDCDGHPEEPVALTVPGSYFKGGLAVTTDGDYVAVASLDQVTIGMVRKE